MHKVFIKLRGLRSIGFESFYTTGGNYSKIILLCVTQGHPTVLQELFMLIYHLLVKGSRWYFFLASTFFLHATLVWDLFLHRLLILLHLDILTMCGLCHTHDFVLLL